jgi:hypothetical protein
MKRGKENLRAIAHQVITGLGFCREPYISAFLYFCVDFKTMNKIFT